MKNLICLSILFFSTIVLYAKNSNHIDDYFSALIEYNYDEANIILSTSELSSELQNELFLLIDILESAGSSNFKDKIKSIDETKHDLLKIARLYQKGYNDLYYNSYKSNAFESFQEAYKLSEFLGSSSLIKFSIIGILEVYHFEMSQSNLQYVIYLERLKELANKSDDWYWYYIYEIYFISQNIDSSDRNAYNFVKKLDSLMVNFKPNHPYQPNYLSLKGVQLEINGQMELALECHNKAIKIAKNYSYLRYIVFRSMIRMSEILRMNKEYSQALKYLSESSAYKDPNDSLRSIIYILEYSSKNYNDAGEHQLAYKFLDSAKVLKDQLGFRSNSIKITELNMLYETEKKNNAILTSNQKVKNFRSLLTIAILAIMFTVGMTYLLYKNTTKKRLLAEQQSELKQQRVDNLLKEQELISIDAMIAGQEKERQKVANELHDDLGSLMATIKLHFDQADISKKNPSLKNAQRLLEEAYSKIRGMAHTKNSGVMSDQGLIPALEKMAAVISNADGLKVEVEHYGLTERLENSLELSIFRTIQELITNILKHADANKASIQLTQHDDTLNIIVEDNGKGFNYSKVAKQNGMGLTNIEKLIENLEGSFTVDSVIGKGSTILIDIPV